MKLTPAAAALVFFAFAFAYFLSALLRAVTATLAPVFSAEFGLSAADLGLLAGAYFLGFASLQLPLGHALDRFGPRRTLLVLLAVAVSGCVAFALAPSLPGLFLARVLIGAGVAAGLMAPLTLYRRLFSATVQLRANSWMLMTGSLGMLASTLPVQWLLPLTGWRGLFGLVAALLAVAMLLIVWLVPRDQPPAASAADSAISYWAIARHPLFACMAPLAFFLYGGMIAVQALWAGPWLTRVTRLSPAEAAQGLFIVNLAMLCAFATWGLLMPRLMKRGLGASRLMAWGLPLPLVLLALNLFLGSAAGPWHWAAWCVACTFISLSQPSVGVAFPAAQAGRALSAFNLVIFSGVFVVQWGVGVLIDVLRSLGVAEVDAFRAAMGMLGLLCAAAYVWFMRTRPKEGR